MLAIIVHLYKLSFAMALMKHGVLFTSTILWHSKATAFFYLKIWKWELTPTKPGTIRGI